MTAFLFFFLLCAAAELATLLAILCGCAQLYVSGQELRVPPPPRCLSSATPSPDH